MFGPVFSWKWGYKNNHINKKAIYHDRYYSAYVRKSEIYRMNSSISLISIEDTAFSNKKYMVNKMGQVIKDNRASLEVDLVNMTFRKRVRSSYLLISLIQFTYPNRFTTWN